MPVQAIDFQADNLNVLGTITGNVVGSISSATYATTASSANYAASAGSALTANTATTATNWSGSTALQAQVNSIATSTGVNTVAISALSASTASLQSSLSAVILSTGALESSKANRSGDTMTGQLIADGGITASSMTTTGLRFTGPCTVGYRLTAIDNNGNMGCQPPASGVEADYFFSRDVFPVTNYNVMYTSAQVNDAISTRTWASIPSGAVVISTFATLPNFPGLTVQPNGTYVIDFRAAKTAGNANQKLFMYTNLYRYTTGGAEILIFTSPTTQITASVPTQYIVSGTTIAFNLDRTDRYLLRTYAYSSGSGSPLPTLALYGGNGYSTKLTTPQPAASVGTYVPWTGGAYDLDLNTHKITASTAVINGPLTVTSSVTVAGNAFVDGYLYTGNYSGIYDASNFLKIGAYNGLSFVTSEAELGSQTERMAINNAGAVAIPGSSFSVGGSTLVVVGGRVGIGTTTPDQRLTVAGNISTTGQVISSGTENNYFGGPITATSEVLSGPLTVTSSVTVTGNAFSVGGSTLVVAGGKVGIGIKPNQALDINVDASVHNNIGLNSGGTPMSVIGSYSSAPFYIYDIYDSSWLLYGKNGGISVGNYGGITPPTGGIILPGNVGVGTTSPSAKLEVAGAVQVSSATLKVSGTGAGILTTGDVTAAYFHGNGAGLTGLGGGGDAILAATQTWTGENTFNSIVTLPTRDKIVFGNEISNSSSAIVSHSFSTTSNDPVCIMGSTVTITSVGNSRILSRFSGAWKPSAGVTCYGGFTIDGINYRNTNSTVTNDSFFGPTLITPTLPSGPHSVCVFIYVSSGGTCYYTGDPYSQIIIEEKR